MIPFFIDTNIPIYASGNLHPHKQPSSNLLKKVALGQQVGVSSSEVLQEILYRYWAIHQPEKGRLVFESFLKIVPVILSVTKQDAVLALNLLIQHPQLSPRDAIHLAVMKRHGLIIIYSYDRHLDEVEGIKRVEP